MLKIGDYILATICTKKELIKRYGIKWNECIDVGWNKEMIYYLGDTISLRKTPQGTFIHNGWYFDNTLIKSYKKYSKYINSKVSVLSEKEKLITIKKEEW